MGDTIELLDQCMMITQKYFSKYSCTKRELGLHMISLFEAEICVWKYLLIRKRHIDCLATMGFKLSNAIAHCRQLNIFSPTEFETVRQLEHNLRNYYQID